jgi:hypothetical protein
MDLIIDRIEADKNMAMKIINKKYNKRKHFSKI